MESKNLKLKLPKHQTYISNHKSVTYHQKAVKLFQNLNQDESKFTKLVKLNIIQKLAYDEKTADAYLVLDKEMGEMIVIH